MQTYLVWQAVICHIGTRWREKRVCSLWGNLYACMRRSESDRRLFRDIFIRLECPILDAAINVEVGGADLF